MIEFLENGTGETQFEFVNNQAKILRRKWSKS
jgi:hypothetical protein